MAQLSPRSVQLISGNGDFNVDGLEDFIHATNFRDRGLSYAVVAIMGPQSSGKSTLMNQLFYTKFKEMNASEGRHQTTKGTWIDKCDEIDPFTIVMDLEGTDGIERGEDDIVFEKQSALFAVAIADVVLINMWCHDIGRDQAANRPLLKTVFQVMMRLFSSRRTTLLFVIRDKSKTPLEKLESQLREDIEKIWEAVPKPQGHESTHLSKFFNVEVTALSSYEEKEEEFKEQVAQLRQRFFHSISPGGLAGDRQGVVPASAFSFSVQQIWKLIKENKDLNLPAHRVMVATFQCEEISNEKLCLLSADEDWLALQKDIQVGPIPGFGKKVHTIIDTYLSDYDKETIYFDEAVRTRKRQDLESKAIDIFYAAYTLMLKHLRFKVFAGFKISFEQSPNGEGFDSAVRICTQSCILEFDQGCADAAIRQANWDASKVREKLLHDIHEYTSSLRLAKLSEIKANFEGKLAAALTEPVKRLFAVGSEDTWASIRRLLNRETEAAVLEHSNAIAGFEMDQAMRDRMVKDLRSYARNLVEKIAREEADKVLNCMKERFLMVFNHGNDSLPRVWTKEVNIETILKDAQTASLRLLSNMAVIRLDEKPDMVKILLFSSLMGGTVDALASNTWEEVSPINMLKSPMECMSLWDQLKKETEGVVKKAISAQEAQKSHKSWLSSLRILGPVVSAFVGLAITEVQQNT